MVAERGLVPSSPATWGMHGKPAGLNTTLAEPDHRTRYGENYSHRHDPNVRNGPSPPELSTVVVGRDHRSALRRSLKQVALMLGAVLLGLVIFVLGPVTAYAGPAGLQLSIQWTSPLTTDRVINTERMYVLDARRHGQCR